MTPVEIIKSMTPNPEKSVWHKQGFSGLKFSDLAAWKGYAEAVHITEKMLSWGNIAPDDCKLFTSYKAFQEAEKKEMTQQNEKNQNH